MYYIPCKLSIQGFHDSVVGTCRLSPNLFATKSLEIYFYKPTSSKGCSFMHIEYLIHMVKTCIEI